MLVREALIFCFILLLPGRLFVAAQSVAIRGVHTGTNSSSGARPARLNIIQLQQDPISWSLYIQALNLFANATEDDPLSFFQIAGIHGRPFKAWDNATGSNYNGYCAHSSILFPTWHRPYLALYEQAIAKYVQLAAAKYTGAAAYTYVNAANSFRIPWWDWAAIPAIPDCMTTPTISITTPWGPQNVSNPLFSYKFPYLEDSVDYFPRNAADGFMALDVATVRAPTAQIDGTSQPLQVDAALAASGLKASVYNLFTRVTDYPDFATMISSGSSLELIHGEVHMCVSGNQNWGQMAYLSYAAYDPIFFLHHTNVDRILALWQAIYPSSFFPQDGMENYGGTYTIVPGDTDYSYSALTPFSSDTAYTYWTSDAARNISTFGYTYPEIWDWSQTPTQLSQNVTSQVNALYTDPTSMKRDLETSTSTREWFLRVGVNQLAFEKSFVLRIFCGQPPIDSRNWSTAANLVGSVPVFVPPLEERSARGITADNITVHGEIPLQTMLAAASKNGTDVTGVTAYLRSNLVWRIQLVDGCETSLPTNSGLDMMVQSESVTPAVDHVSFPTYGNAEQHPEVMEGKF